MGFEELKTTERTEQEAQTNEHLSQPEVGGDISERLAEQTQREAAQKVEDATDLSETREELANIKAPKIELAYEGEDLAEAAERLQDSLREKGEQIKLTPEQMKELQGVVDKYITLTEDATLQEGNGYDDMRYFIGREARKNVQKMEVRNKIVEISSTVVEAALPPAAIASAFVMTPSLVPSVLLLGGTIYGLANAISLGNKMFTTISSENPRITALVNFFARKAEEKQLENSEWLKVTEEGATDLFPSYATFLQNSDEFFAIVERLKKTESFKLLGELAEDLRSVIANTDEQTGDLAREKFLKKKTEVLGNSLQEANLSFSDQDIKMLMGEAVIIRAEKNASKRTDEEKAKHLSETALSAFNSQLEEIDESHTQFVDEREDAEKELEK